MNLNDSNQLVGQIRSIKDQMPLQINIDDFPDIKNFISHIRDYREITNLQLIIDRFRSIFPNYRYYQNLSDTFEYYFNPELDGNLYIYSNIKELNDYIFADLELIHTLKSNPERYNKEFFINFIALVITKKYKLKIPIHKTSLYENLFGSLIEYLRSL